MIFELHDCTAATTPTIGFARVVLSFSEREVAHRGHDLMRRCAGISLQPSERLAQTVRLALQVDDAGGLER